MKNAMDDQKRRIAQVLEESRWAWKELKRQASQLNSITERSS